MTLSTELFDICLIINLLLSHLSASTLPHLVVYTLRSPRTLLLGRDDIVLVHQLLVLFDDLLNLVDVTVVFVRWDVQLARRLQPVLQLLLRLLVGAYVIDQRIRVALQHLLLVPLAALHANESARDREQLLRADLAVAVAVVRVQRLHHLALETLEMLEFGLVVRIARGRLIARERRVRPREGD